MTKKDSYYFNCFINCAQLASEAACLLRSIVKDFHVEDLQLHLVKMHEIEHNADKKKHELMSELARAFITPLEREDIIRLSQFIDDVTDSVEEVLQHIYISGVTQIREEVITFVELIVRCCTSLNILMKEFPNFKKSKTLSSYIISINQLEEEGDRLYLKVMRELHTSQLMTNEIMIWREIYGYLEKCCDTCEHVADSIEGIRIANT